MTQVPLTDIFGANATQDSDTLTISKSDLTGVGLVLSASNTAESLFMAILNNAQINLTDANQQNNPDQSIVVETPPEPFVTRDGTNYSQTAVSIIISKLPASTTIEPNNY